MSPIEAGTDLIVQRADLIKVLSPFLFFSHLFVNLSSFCTCHVSLRSSRSVLIESFAAAYTGGDRATQVRPKPASELAAGLRSSAYVPLSLLFVSSSVVLTVALCLALAHAHRG